MELCLRTPDHIYRYHSAQLTAQDGEKLESTFGNQPKVQPNDAGQITELLS
jgi:hypothetical protein